MSSSGSGSLVSLPPHDWIEAFNGDVPDGAIEGGNDDRNEKLYVARGLFKDILLPGYLHPKDGCVFVSFAGNVGKLSAYEVLCNAKVSWTEDGDADKAYVSWDTDESYMMCGKIKHKNSVLPAMFHVDNDVFYAVYQGKEVASKKGEYLILEN